MSCEQPASAPLGYFTRAVPTANRPYLDKTPSLKIERLNAAYFYAFNYAKPTGVILLTDRANDFLQATLTNTDAKVASSGLSETAKKKLLQFLNPVSSPRPQTRTYWIHVTDSCNLGCFYCYIDDVDRYRSVAREELSLGAAQLVLARVMEEARANGIRRIHFKFAGGEPTLALGAINNFCETARNVFQGNLYDISFGIITNGTCSTAAFLSLIKKFKINISISVDGFEETHDRTRQLGPDIEDRSTWRLISETTIKILGIGIRPYFLHTLTPNNIRGINSLQKFINNQGLGFRISLLRLAKMPSPDVITRFRDTLIDFYDRVGQTLPLGLSVNKHVQFAEWNPFRLKTLACGAGRNYFSVSSQGEISTCQMSAGRPLASLQNTTITDARIIAQQKPDTCLLINPEKRVGGCSRCFFMGTCTGGCPQHTYSVHSTMSHISPWCEVYGALYPVYIRSIAQHLYRRLTENMDTEAG